MNSLLADNFHEMGITLSLTLYFCPETVVCFLHLLHIYYCHKVKHIFIRSRFSKVRKNSLSFGFYSTCTLVFWLPNLDKFD